GFLLAVRAGAHVHVVGVEGDPRELGVGVGVLVGETSPGEDADPSPGPGEPLGGDTHCFGPGSELQGPGVLVTHQGAGQPVGLGRVGECPATLVAVPFLVDLRVVPGQAACDLTAPVVGALGAAAGTVFTDAGCGDQVYGSGAGPVGGDAESAHTVSR